jgi:PAS domain S-box-containing protein
MSARRTVRGDTSDRVADPPHTGEHPGAAELAADWATAAAAAVTLVDVQVLVARIGRSPGVQAAVLGAAGVAAHPMELALPIGVPAWRLALRVTVADEDAYTRIQPICREVAAAADRVLAQGCYPSTGPTTRPTTGPAAEPPGDPATSLYRAVTAGSHVLIVSVHPTDGWTVLSDAFRDMLGYNRLAPPGGRLIDLVHPDDHAAAMATFAAACAGRQPSGSVDLRVSTADGRWRTLEVVTRSFVTDPQIGTVVFFALDVTGDRTAERVAELERERLATLVDALPDGIVLLDSDTRVELANDAARQLFALGDIGFRDWEQVLRALHGALHGSAGTVDRLRRAVGEDRVVQGAELEFAAGRTAECDVVPVLSGKRRLGTLIHIRDVTAQVAVRRGLEERSRGLEERNRSLAEASAQNNQFVATVAHELRGPLSSVVAFSHLLGDATSGTLSEDQRTYLDVIDRNANRLLRLIEDLLLLSRLEARTLQLQPTTVHLPDLLAAAVAERTPTAALAGIALRCETVDGPELLCDDTRIHQVVDNLISNALKFTPNGGQVTVRARPEAEAWIIEVADSGIGIPASDLSRLFQAFFRGSSPPSSPVRQASPGTGLGLVVSRAIVELHGGTIGVASTEGVGTTVTLSLPARPLKKDAGAS